MSNLTPEKRINKNGVAVTKHVLSSKPAASGRKMPAPSMPKDKGVAQSKKLTLKQTKQRFQGITVESLDRSRELFDALGYSYRQLSFSGEASDEQVYGLLSIASPANAMVMFNAGIKDRDEAVEKLKSLGLEHLIEDNSHRTDEALERRISPDQFIMAIDKLDGYEESPYFMDAVEAWQIHALKDYTELPVDIITRRAKLSDVKTIGAARIKKSGCWSKVRMALGELATDNAGYTAEDVKTVLDRYSTRPVFVDNTLTMANQFGAEFALSIQTPSSTLTSLRHKLYDEKTDPERAKSIIKYADTLWTLMEKNWYPEQHHVGMNDIVFFHDSGITPEEIVEGNLSVQQVDAIGNNGVAKSVSDGWL